MCRACSDTAAWIAHLPSAEAVADAVQCGFEVIEAAAAAAVYSIQILLAFDQTHVIAAAWDALLLALASQKSSL